MAEKILNLMWSLNLVAPKSWTNSKDKKDDKNLYKVCHIK